MPLSWLWAASRPEDRIPRHEVTVSPIVARKLELAYQREEMRVGQEE